MVETKVVWKTVSIWNTKKTKRYDAIRVGIVEQLIFFLSKDRSNVIFYVHFDEIFIITHKTQLSAVHGGTNIMLKQLQ